MRMGSRQPQQKRMTCWNCRRYDRNEFRCLDGKTNPKKKADTIMVAELLGLRALCHYNLYRDLLAQRIHYPNDPLTIDSSARIVRKKWSVSAGIEPDLAANYPSSATSMDSNE